jgi:hypothetical protein
MLDAEVGGDWSGSPRIVRLVSEVPGASDPKPVWRYLLEQVEHQQEHFEIVRERLEQTTGNDGSGAAQEKR